MKYYMDILGTPVAKMILDHCTGLFLLLLVF